MCVYVVVFPRLVLLVPSLGCEEEKEDEEDKMPKVEIYFYDIGYLFFLVLK